MKLICILSLKLNGAGEVVVKPSFSISDLSYLIIAEQNDLSFSIIKVTEPVNDMRRAHGNTTSDFKTITGWLNLISFPFRSCFVFSSFAIFAGLMMLGVNIYPSKSKHIAEYLQRK